MTVRLLHLSRDAFSALAAGDVPSAERLLGLPVPAELAGAVEIWTYMLQLLDERHDNAEWLMHAVVDGDVVVGNAGFKGAPVDGQVELGYCILPPHRRRGLATAAVRLLLDRARREPTVDRVIARIAPGNAPSVGVVTRCGFVPERDHLHPRWGRQLQLWHPADARSS
jgi:ribosomal-protein-alanine N-acetyltransferase